jgi:hypothetical protein
MFGCCRFFLLLMLRCLAAAASVADVPCCYSAGTILREANPRERLWPSRLHKLGTRNTSSLRIT